MMTMVEVTATETGSQSSEPTMGAMSLGHCADTNLDFQVDKMKNI